MGRIHEIDDLNQNKKNSNGNSKLHKQHKNLHFYLVTQFYIFSRNKCYRKHISQYLGTSVNCTTFQHYRCVLEQFVCGHAMLAPEEAV